MGIESHATPQDRLRALADGQASLLETLARVQVEAQERAGRALAPSRHIRRAGRGAADAAPVSYRAHLGTAGLSPAKILAALVAIAPVVGSARVLSAASKLAQAGLVPADPHRITRSG
jgi:4-carboxymuconolactone decarboxylase